MHMPIAERKRNKEKIVQLILDDNVDELIRLIHEDEIKKVEVKEKITEK